MNTLLPKSLEEALTSQDNQFQSLKFVTRYDGLPIISFIFKRNEVLYEIQTHMVPGHVKSSNHIKFFDTFLKACSQYIHPITKAVAIENHIFSNTKDKTCLCATESNNTISIFTIRSPFKTKNQFIFFESDSNCYIRAILHNTGIRPTAANRGGVSHIDSWFLEKFLYDLVLTLYMDKPEKLNYQDLSHIKNIDGITTSVVVLSSDN